jgi:hypothetical protein
MSIARRKKGNVEEQMKPCPFCGCRMGILELEGGWRWWGVHGDLCVLEGNHSSWYGRRDFMIEEWNRRADEQKPKHRQKKVPVHVRKGLSRRRKTAGN